MTIAERNLEQPQITAFPKSQQQLAAPVFVSFVIIVEAGEQLAAIVSWLSSSNNFEPHSHGSLPTFFGF